MRRAKWLWIILLAASLLSGAQTSPVDRAYNNGYDAGYQLGLADGKAGRPADFSQSVAYRRATDGWNARLGDREQYRMNFRAGFRDGYQDGHREGRGAAPMQAVPPPPPRVSAARAGADEAFANGYREGYTRGQRDAGGSYRALETPVYKDARQGYDAGRFPSLEDYQFNFRQGYEAGYDDGYNRRASNSRRDVPRTFSQQRASSTAPSTAGARASITVAEGTILRLRLNNTLSTRSSRQGDRFTATVTEPVNLPGSSEVAIPAGSTVTGTVEHVERPGRVRGIAEMQLRYESITLPNGAEYRLQATTAAVEDREGTRVEEEEGAVKGQKSTGRDVGTVAAGGALGAIVGAIAGGGKGAGIGAAVGSAVGLGGVLASRGKDIDLPSGTPMDIRIQHPLQLQR